MPALRLADDKQALSRAAVKRRIKLIFCIEMTLCWFAAGDEGLLLQLAMAPTQQGSGQGFHGAGRLRRDYQKEK